MRGSAASFCAALSIDEEVEIMKQNGNKASVGEVTEQVLEVSALCLGIR